MGSTDMNRLAITARDRAYLRDYIKFGLMNHVVAAEALRSAYQHADGAAATVRQLLERVDKATAADMAGQLNDAARVQTIVVARLMSEYAAAIEDLAGMMVAVRDRSAGVMSRYFTSTPAETGAMLQELEGSVDLPALLGLPSVDEQRGAIGDEALEALEHTYGVFTEHLRSVATAARQEGPAGVPVGLGDLELDRLALVLGIGDAGTKGPRGLLFQAHNKIKHRFMVIEDIATVGATPGDPVRFGHLPRDQAMVMRLVGNIAQVALSTGELAALLLMLDQAAGAGAE
jgi:hypothetical protein